MSEQIAASQAPEDGFDRLLGWLSAIPVGVIVLLTFIDVLGRYIFAAPVKGGSEIIEYAMALVIFTALPMITRHRGHVTVSLIDGMVKGSVARLKIALCDLISAFALGLMTWRLVAEGIEAQNSKASTIVLGLPNAPLAYAMAVLAGLSALVVLSMIVRQLRGDGARS